MIEKLNVLKNWMYWCDSEASEYNPGHVKLDWLPPPKVDRVNDNPAHYQH